MKLDVLLRKENNNLDLFRLIAAIAVIYGHAYALSPQVGKIDLFQSLFLFDSSSAFAVKVFFFLSGLLVTNSLLIKRSPLQFVIARVFRIWPALIVSVIVLALVVGPILSDLPFQSYFVKKETYAYIYNNVQLYISFHLPGVFVDNLYEGAVNGSLWSIPYEVTAYCILLASFNFGGFKVKLLSLIVAVLIFIDISNGSIVMFKGDMTVAQLAFCFSVGVVLTVYRSSLSINLTNMLSAWVLYYILRDLSYSFLLLQLAFFITILYISSIDFVVKHKFKNDISYGVYLWGFPVQQIISKYFLDYGIVFNQVSSIIIACICGYLSWHFIEKKSIQLGAQIVKSASFRRIELR